MRALVDFDPLVPCEPDHPPDAVHDVALLELQVNWAALPDDTLVGFAVSDTVGTPAATATDVEFVAVPPEPVHASVKV